ncbi:hypothetical protein J2Z18_001068 [Paenibacillus lactis]|uniref:Uncharacterized protein n=1 Tax=Paenibacillus lactis TaxID=228574 RepID=A0ABS4F6W8_9BACL|nr:hypothetical protein [Paenibacillus lactis]GIO89239.1 hypothetical protein J31TS3_04660 [Paenibacillus lactis]
MQHYFAIETGPETTAHLRSARLGLEGHVRNFDPANMVLVTGDYPL